MLLVAGERFSLVWFSLRADCLSQKMAEDVAEDLRKMGFRVRSPLEMAKCGRVRLF